MVLIAVPREREMTERDRGGKRETGRNRETETETLRRKVDIFESSFSFRVSLRTIFSAVDTQTVVLVSTAKVWISVPDT